MELNQINTNGDTEMKAIYVKNIKAVYATVSNSSEMDYVLNTIAKKGLYISNIVNIIK